MGLLNATEASPEEFAHDHAHALTEGERVWVAYKTMRDWIVFTDWRVLHMDVQGLTGSKRQYFSVPYKSVTAFAIESAGTFDLDAEIKIYLSGHQPIQFKIGRKSDVSRLQSLMAEKLRG
ncbi:PH domain-containing protein [Qipengyuania sp. JC766]|uniref:PH domain-containing protein n=1 Tax=Qipengyuania sp. JC766 TaxID=3232139 RepID=UPI00345B2D44